MVLDHLDRHNDRDDDEDGEDEEEAEPALGARRAGRLDRLLCLLETGEDGQLERDRCTAGRTPGSCRQKSARRCSRSRRHARPARAQASPSVSFSQHTLDQGEAAPYVLHHLRELSDGLLDLAQVLVSALHLGERSAGARLAGLHELGRVSGGVGRGETHGLGEDLSARVIVERGSDLLLRCVGLD